MPMLQEFLRQDMHICVDLEQSLSELITLFPQQPEQELAGAIR